MNKYDYNKQHKINIVLALGFFDTVHVGHKHLLNLMLNLSKDLNAESSVFTFINSPFIFFRKDTKEILTFDERCKVFNDLGIENVIYANMDENFVSLSGEEFLDTICKNYNVKGIVCGQDYTYGKNASGNVKTLKEYCLNNNIELIVDDLLMIDNKKISSTSIRKYIKEGNIEKINEMLGSKYFITGEVIHCAGRGKLLGFPTANIVIPYSKMPLQSGVYQAIVTVDGKRYKAITNVGDRPTFNEKSYIIESYLEDFNQDIYGKTIMVEFVKKIRGIVHFDSKEGLINQLETDKKTLKELSL